MRDEQEHGVRPSWGVRLRIKIWLRPKLQLRQVEIVGSIFKSNSDSDSPFVCQESSLRSSSSMTCFELAWLFRTTQCPGFESCRSRRALMCSGNEMTHVSESNKLHKGWEHRQWKESSKKPTVTLYLRDSSNGQFRWHDWFGSQWFIRLFWVIVFKFRCICNDTSHSILFKCVIFYSG